ncbi:integral membrane protein [Colletotrichum asianum]|uniref:Integral membrane n=1 Tax=Colletotrichum asianum TaxID=702518 RepID=A0A8H3WQT6_9PEZI|nr:integral membrane [Colletotrichum asianum]
MVTMNHDYTKGQMIGLAVGFMIIPTIFYVLRIWAKLLVKRFAWDDYLAGFALLVSITCCTLQLSTAIHGHLGQHQPTFPDGSPIMDDPGLIFFEENKFALNMISILGLGLVKSSILVLYRSLFPSRRFHYVVYAALAFVIGWTVSFFFSHLFTCYPITVFIEPYYGNSCVQTVPMFLALLFTDVVADFAILIIPIPMVIRVRMPLKKKLAVIGMLGLGAAVCAVSLTRVIATFAIAEEYIKHPNDVIYYTAPVFFWTNIELSLAIVCACLPTLRPIWLHFFPKPAATGSNSYEYGSSKRYGARKSSLRTPPYEELDELELTRHDGLTRSGSVRENDIVRETTIHQTIEPSDNSSTANLGTNGLGL